MKIFLLAVCFSFLLVVKGISQTIKYDQFLKEVGKQFNPAKAIKQSCDWQYAVVKIQTNKTNRVIGYNLLNQVPNGMAEGFKFLMNYQFPLNTPIYSRPIIFCVSIENMKMDCAALKKQYTPSEILGSVYANIKPQMEKQPKTILIFDVVVVSYEHDVIK